MLSHDSNDVNVLMRLAARGLGAPNLGAVLITHLPGPHADRFAGEHRPARELAAMPQLDDLPAVRGRARRVSGALDAGDL